MRIEAKREGKSVPSTRDIEQLASGGMFCYACGDEMFWHISMSPCGRKKVASLQHDRSGTVRLLCVGCNSRHQHMPGDSFYSLEPGYKWCRRCKRVLLLSKFSVYGSDSRHSGQVYSYCKSCNRERSKKYRKNHLEKVLAIEKRSRAKRAAKRKLKQHQAGQEESK